MSVKVLEKRMREGIACGDFYVAEQSCRTLYNRLMRAPKDGSSVSQENSQKALEYALEGAKLMLAKDQFQAGSALALLAFKHLGTNAVTVSAKGIMNQVTFLCSEAYQGTAKLAKDLALEAHKEQLRVVKSAIKWSSLSSCDGTRHGDQKLNTTAGLVAMSVGKYEDAQGFFVRSDSPDEFAKLLDVWVSDTGIASERDLFLTRAVLMYLVSENIADADKLRKAFAELSGWPSGGRPTEANPTPALGNFCDILIKACQVGARGSSLFHRIREVYGPALAVDPALDPLLASVAQMYFNIQPPQPTGMAAMMQSMLKGMMGPGPVVR